MRIVLISAHFPPEFVSGGTLQPQRLARALARRGHSVTVWAGSLDSTRLPLDTWATDDDDGVAVRWIASGPFIGWSDERNYDNPGVARAFGRALDELRPDVVHAHSLQGLGVGVLEEAARRAVPVVLTMHDFWWVCARQFLVDREHVPCSLVVDASACPCEAGRDHLTKRALRLREALATVDRILVPSEAARQVLVANGVPKARTAVDENAVPAPSPSAPRRPTAVPLVARYTGGSNPMKGADVLIDAARALGSQSGLQIVAHGIDEALSRHGLSPGDLPITTADPYPPDQLDAVLEATDVLLLPSVMRETFSIVTREALARQVPVLATDVLGPEEVVHDGVNGRILRAGDPAELAIALQALIDAPGIVDRWREGIGPVHLRSLADQAEGLERIYGDLLGDRSPPVPAAAGPNGLRHVLFVVGIDGAPLRYRAQLPAEALADKGTSSEIRHYRDPDLDAAAARADTVVLYRVPATPHVLALIDRVRLTGTPVACDLDDLIFDDQLEAEIPALAQLQGDERALWLEGVRRYRTTMQACDAFIGSTPAIVEHARAVVGMPAFHFPNGVGRLLAIASDAARRRPRRPGPLRIGYLSGTDTHDADWQMVAPAIHRVLEARPDVELWLGGHLVVDDATRSLGDRLRVLPFRDWLELPEVLRDLDVNLAPLTGHSRFNEAKSAIKWLEAALCGTPTIASPTAPFEDAITEGVDGMLAADDAAWEQALLGLIDDPSAALAMGERAQRAAVLRWSPHLQGERYLEVLQAVSAAAREQSPRHLAPPVVRDEPPLPSRTPLSPYGSPAPASPGPQGGPGSAARLARLLARAAAVAREDGPVTAIRRTPQALRRRLALRRR